MAAIGQVVTVGTSATLIFSVLDKETYTANGYTTGANPNIFISSSSNDPLPLLMILPSTATIYMGGATVTASGGANPGAAVTGLPTLAYNCVGGDSLYGVVSSSTQAISLLVLRQ